MTFSLAKENKQKLSKAGKLFYLYKLIIMSTEWKDYVKDPRTICKYGVNCYQKNSDHLSKFKHPPHKTKRHKVEIEGHTVKRPKIVANDNEEAATSQTEVSGDTVEPSDTASATASPRDALSSTHQHNLIKLPDNLTYHNNCDENLMRKLFLVDMPGDFYKFFECLQSENSFETLLSTVNLQLIGPFDLLLGKLPIVDPDLYLIHWRFFFDPPEFQVCLKANSVFSLDCMASGVSMLVFVIWILHELIYKTINLILTFYCFICTC